MIVRLAYMYVYLVSGLMSLLMLGLAILHVTYLCGNQFELNGHLFAVFFAINVPALGLAADRNIWAHEVKACPRWMRVSLPILFAYALLAIVFNVVLGMGPISPRNAGTAITSFMFMFSFGSACVLYATLKSARTDQPEFLKRIQRSLVVTAVAAVLCFLSTFLPPKISLQP